jgi:hypothetical protein
MRVILKCDWYTHSSKDMLKKKNGLAISETKNNIQSSYINI